MLDMSDHSTQSLVRLALYTVIAVVAGTISAVRTIRRRRAIKQLAEASGFERLGSELADGLYLRKTSFAWRDIKIFNSLKGTIRGVQVAIFDVSYQTEDRSKNVRVTQTVVGFRREGALSCDEAPSTHQSEYVFEIAGDWLIYFSEGRQIKAEQLEAWCNQVYDYAAKLIREQAGIASEK